jgi:hypothetical protein
MNRIFCRVLNYFLLIFFVCSGQIWGSHREDFVDSVFSRHHKCSHFKGNKIPLTREERFAFYDVGVDFVKAFNSYIQVERGEKNNHQYLDDLNMRKNLPTLLALDKKYKITSPKSGLNYIAEIKKQRVYRELEQSKKRLLEENLTQLYTYISQNPIETLKSGANISELLSRVWDLTFKGPDNDETRTAQRIIAEKISRIKTQGINRGTYADYAAQLFEVYYQSLRHKFATSNHHGHHQSHRYHHRHHIKHKGLRRSHFSVNRRVLCKSLRQIMAHQKRELIDRQKQSRLVIAQKKKAEAARQRRAQQIAAQKKKEEVARQRRVQQIAAQKKKEEAARQRRVQQIAVQQKKAEVARQRQQARFVAIQKKKVKK